MLGIEGKPIEMESRGWDFGVRWVVDASFDVLFEGLISLEGFLKI